MRLFAIGTKASLIFEDGDDTREVALNS